MAGICFTCPSAKLLTAMRRGGSRQTDRLAGGKAKCSHSKAVGDAEPTTLPSSPIRAACEGCDGAFGVSADTSTVRQNLIARTLMAALGRHHGQTAVLFFDPN
jgi:hypothetical protein